MYTKPTRGSGLPKMGTDRGWLYFWGDQRHPRCPGGEDDPKATSNDDAERSKPSSALSPRAGVNRMRRWERIAEEANACGKATGYADVGTAGWRVGAPVGVNML